MKHMSLDDSVDNLEDARPFNAVPTVVPPPDLYRFLPRWFAETALEHGPIYRRHIEPEFRERLGEWLVYMVGPEANRYVMQGNREAFSHDRGWTPNLEPLMERGLLNTDDPEHAWQRKMMNPAFAI